MQGQQAGIKWETGDTPVSEVFDDPYFSKSDGLAETRYVFLDGNELPVRFRPGFHIAELGFGTGLTFLCCVEAWKRSAQTGTLRFTSFEAFPMDPSDMARAHQAFPELASLSGELRKALSRGDTELTLHGVHLSLVLGDARKTLPQWQGTADAWCLDGFSPAKNPELWEAGLMQSVFDHTAPGGSFATYTAAGHVRRALQDAGFDVSRRQGFGRKRHMTTGVRT